MPALFNPTLSSQRYSYVESFLMQRPDITSITDVGCGNGRMVNWIKTVPTIERVNCLDSDYNLLEGELDRYLRPNLLEAIFGRKNSDKEIAINVYQGDVAIPDDRLKADCFSLVEMIEHITLEEVETITRTIFSYYQPKHVVVTTPNTEFNQLLAQHDSSEGDPNKPKDPNNKFRHFDHKFEWTRAEFNQWAHYVCTTYNYEYYMDGVGHLPGSEPYGPCTQIAVFTRKSNLPTPIEQGDLACFDLLLNKLSVADSQHECLGDFSKKRICLVGSFTVPGNMNVSESVDPNASLSWTELSSKTDQQSTSQGEQTSQELDDCIKCDKEYCYCRGNKTGPEPTELYWQTNEMDDCEIDDDCDVQQADFQESNTASAEIVWW